MGAAAACPLLHLCPSRQHSRPQGRRPTEAVARKRRALQQVRQRGACCTWVRLLHLLHLRPNALHCYTAAP